MHYDLLRPCSNCPFLREGGVRLTEARVEEIAGMMISPAGGDFPCHKTTVDTDDGDRHSVSASRHCAGALIFAEKNGNATQMMRIAERLGMYDSRKLMADQAAVESVFNDLDEMLESNRMEATRAPRRNHRKRRSKAVPGLRRKA